MQIHLDRSSSPIPPRHPPFSKGPDQRLDSSIAKEIKGTDFFFGRISSLLSSLVNWFKSLLCYKEKQEPITTNTLKTKGETYLKNHLNPEHLTAVVQPQFKTAVVFKFGDRIIGCHTDSTTKETLQKFCQEATQKLNETLDKETLPSKMGFTVISFILENRGKEGLFLHSEHSDFVAHGKTGGGSGVATGLGIATAIQRVLGECQESPENKKFTDPMIRFLFEEFRKKENV